MNLDLNLKKRIMGKLKEQLCSYTVKLMKTNILFRKMGKH